MEQLTAKRCRCLPSNRSIKYHLLLDRTRLHVLTGTLMTCWMETLPAAQWLAVAATAGTQHYHGNRIPAQPRWCTLLACVVTQQTCALCVA